MGENRLVWQSLQEGYFSVRLFYSCLSSGTGCSSHIAAKGVLNSCIPLDVTSLLRRQCRKDPFSGLSHV